MNSGAANLRRRMQELCTIDRSTSAYAPQLHDVAIEEYGENFKAFRHTACVANSQFTAETYRQVYGIESFVIHPFIAAEQYRICTKKENVTFINPVPEKGCELALKIARLCPEIPFSFIEGWPLTEAQRTELDRKLSGLPNVEFLRSQKDMRSIYAKCRILLVPSLFSETFGRVVTEAQASGIPVVSSKRGGLPESVGPGGVLLDPDGPIEAWVLAVRKLWRDEPYYLELSDAALAHSQRPEMTFSRQTDLWEKALVAASKNVGNGISKQL